MHDIILGWISAAGERLRNGGVEYVRRSFEFNTKFCHRMPVCRLSCFIPGINLDALSYTCSQLKMAIFWPDAQCCVVEVYRRLRDDCCFHHQGDKAAISSEMSVNFYQTTLRIRPDDSHLLTGRSENMKSHMFTSM